MWRPFGIVRVGIIPLHMWPRQAVLLLITILEIVVPFAICIWLRHVIHPYIVEAVAYVEAVAERTMN